MHCLVAKINSSNAHTTVSCTTDNIWTQLCIFSVFLCICFSIPEARPSTTSIRDTTCFIVVNSQTDMYHDNCIYYFHLLLKLLKYQTMRYFIFIMYMAWRCVFSQQGNQISHYFVCQRCKRLHAKTRGKTLWNQGKMPIGWIKIKKLKFWHKKIFQKKRKSAEKRNSHTPVMYFFISKVKISL